MKRRVEDLFFANETPPEAIRDLLVRFPRISERFELLDELLRALERLGMLGAWIENEHCGWIESVGAES